MREVQRVEETSKYMKERSAESGRDKQVYEREKCRERKRQASI
jgi:hypothetical protein